MKTVTIGQFLSPSEIRQAEKLYRENRSGFAATVDQEIISPNLARINRALGQENNSCYLAYAVEYALSQTERTRTQ